MLGTPFERISFEAIEEMDSSIQKGASPKANKRK